MSKKKILTIAIAVALVAILVVGASLAYFTDTTEKAENVITIGKVDIELEEKNWDPEADHIIIPGKEIDKEPTITVEEKSEDCYLFVELEISRYVPMIDYLKNTRKIDLSSPNPIAIGQALTDNFLIGFENKKWEIMNAADLITMYTSHAADTAWDGTVTIILGYQEVGGADKILSAGDEVTVFTGVRFPADLDEDNAPLFWKYANGDPKPNAPGDIDVNITAKAIQSLGLDSRLAAYKALYKIAD